MTATPDNDGWIELAERCEAASADEWPLIREAGLRVFGPGSGGVLKLNKLCDTGAFLDAAMTLVPEGSVWLRKTPETMSIYTPPKTEKMWANHIDGKGKSPALALCAAALRARAVKP